MLRSILTALAGLVVAAVASTAMNAEDTPRKGDSGIGFIQVGHISRIDTKNHSLMLSTPKDQKEDQSSTAPRVGGFGRGGRFGRFGGPTPPDIARQAQHTFETKVVLTSETIFKDREGTLRFDDLKVGDFVEVDGIMHGNDFRAKELLRHSKKADSPKIP
jgi:hypothetical protein